MHSCAWVVDFFGQYLYVTSYMVEGIQIHQVRLPAPNPPLKYGLSDPGSCISAIHPRWGSRR